MILNKFVGNSTIILQVQSLIKNKKMPQAIMLIGEKGLGKKSLASIISQFLVCDNLKNGIPCGVCTHCKKAQKNVHPDIIYPEKSGTLKTYNIATVREIRKYAYILPNEAKNKIYIFTDVDKLGISAQNAFLKILEDPPKNVFFIFTCTSAVSLLPTVRSRAQQFSLEYIKFEDIEKYLIELFPKKEKYEIKNVSEMCKGNIGLAIKYLESPNFGLNISLINDLTKNISNMNEFDLLISLNKVIVDKNSFDSFLFFFRLSLKNLLIKKSESKIFSKRKIVQLIDLLDEFNKLLNQNVNFSLLISCFCTNMHKIIFEN